MKNKYIYPGETTQVDYWTKKLGITQAQLHEAIMDTGSLNVDDIRKYLKKKRFTFSITGIRRFLKLNLSI